MSDQQAAHHSQRVTGALVGSVVGDALGAPFEFGPPMVFSRRFPTAQRGLQTEMCGGRGWQPGEWTDDTQMALLTAASLLEKGRLDEADLFGRYQGWVAAGPRDVGIQTRRVLTSGRPWSAAAAEDFAAGHTGAGNGSLMRATPAAIFFSHDSVEGTADAARRISMLTHGDPAAGEGCVIFHLMVRAALAGTDPVDVVDDALGQVQPAERPAWATVLAPDWTPEMAEQSNGAVWPTLGSAVWALRHATSFERAMRLVLDLGGDTDTVAAVTGGLAGATYGGIEGIPSRWTSVVNGELPGHPPMASNLAELQDLALRLDGREPIPEPADPGGLAAVEVAPGLWCADLVGAIESDPSFVVISLCRTLGRITHERTRQVYLADNDSNLDVDAVLADVLDDIDALHADEQQVLVHCHGGASRTGLVLRGWLRRHEGLSADEATAEARLRWPQTGEWNTSFSEALARL